MTLVAADLLYDAWAMMFTQQLSWSCASGQMQATAPYPCKIQKNKHQYYAGAADLVISIWQSLQLCSLTLVGCV